MGHTQLLRLASLFCAASMFMKPLSEEMARSVARKVADMLPGAVLYTEEEADALEDEKEQSFWDMQTDFPRVLFYESSSSGGAGVAVFPVGDEPFTLTSIEMVPAFVEKVRSLA